MDIITTILITGNAIIGLYEALANKEYAQGTFHISIAIWLTVLLK